MSFFEWSPPTEILSDISILTSYLAYSLTFYLAFDLTSLLTFYLTSCTRNWGPAVPTEIWRSRLTAESEELQGDEKAEGGQQHKIWPGGEKWQAGALDSSTPIHPCIVPVHCGQACGHLDHLVVSRENMQKPMGFWSCLPSKTIKCRTFNRSVLSIHLEYDHPFDQLNVVQPPRHSIILPFHWLVGNDDHPQCILDSVTPELIINQQGLWTWLKILKIPSNPHGCLMVLGCHSHGYQPPRRSIPRSLQLFAG
jgi:hypothetical protein